METPGTSNRCESSEPPQPPPGRSAQVGVLFVMLALLVTYSLSFWSRENTTPLPAAKLELLLDPNFASRDELMLLPRIGEKTADAIIAFREAYNGGPAYRSPADLEQVRGVGPITVARLTPFLTFSEVSTSPADRQTATE
ncbi:MAG: ComEA family DNA-binding protein [Phycisphaerae bacterium]